MFISWAVTSYQSNGAGCDFSQGISVCLIEILYPISLAGRPGLRRRPCAPLVHFRAILTLVTLSPLCCCSFLRSLSRDLCLLSCFLSFRLPFASSSFRLRERLYFARFCLPLPLVLLRPSFHRRRPRPARSTIVFRLHWISGANRYCVLSVMAFYCARSFRPARTGEVTEDSRVSLWPCGGIDLLSFSLPPFLPPFLFLYQRLLPQRFEPDDFRAAGSPIRLHRDSIERVYQPPSYIRKPRDLRRE